MRGRGVKVLVSGSTVTVGRLLRERPDRVGCLLTPSDGNAEWWPAGTEWAADNDCFAGLNAPRYLRLLARILAFRSRPLWVSCPDKVGDSAETMRLFGRWQPMLREIGVRVALVGQDGLTAAAVPWADVDAVFVGGSTAWKLSDDAAAITLAAHARGLPVHYGRVNSRRRIVWLARGIRDGRLWCDTFDGSGWSKFAEARLPLAVRWIDEGLKDKQLVMFGGTA